LFTAQLAVDLEPVSKLEANIIEAARAFTDVFRLGEIRRQTAYIQSK